MIARYSATPASDERAELAESPIWDGRVLRWVDMNGHQIFALDPQRQTTIRRALSTDVHAIALAADDELLAVTASGLGWLDESTGNVAVRRAVLTDDTLVLNDGAVDVAGRYWFGSATTDGSARGSLYRYASSRLDVVVGGVMMSNGIDWSPDGRTLYHADSSAGTIVAWNCDPGSGEIDQPRLFRSIASSIGLPDGLTVDSDGRVWVALWGAGEVWALDGSSGEQIAVVSLPTPLTSSCAFGGTTLGTGSTSLLAASGRRSQ